MVVDVVDEGRWFFRVVVLPLNRLGRVLLSPGPFELLRKGVRELIDEKECFLCPWTLLPSTAKNHRFESVDSANLTGVY